MIGKAEPPGLTGFDGPDQWVTVFLPVFPGMSVDRVVTASNGTALEARAEMNPGVAGRHTLIAHIRAGLDDRGELFQVRTQRRGHLIFLEVVFGPRRPRVSTRIICP